MLWSALLVVLMVGVVLALTPRLLRRAVPLGVSVPAERVADPAVVAALAGYRRSVLVGAVAVLGLTVALEQVRESAGLAAGPLLMLLPGLVAVVWHRRPIIAAKQEQQWYAGLPVRLTANVTPERPARVGWAWHAGALLVSGGGLAYGAAVVDRLPDPFPVHTGPDGMPDEWGPRTYLNVLSGQLLAVAMVLFLAGVAWAMSRAPVQVRPDGDVEGSRRRAVRMQQLVQSMMGLINLVTAVGVTALEAATWNAWQGQAMQLVLGAFVVSTLLPAVVLVARASAIEQDQALEDLRQAKAARARGERVGADSPDDDRLWRRGVVYDNPDDPRTFVPKRVGLGSSVNLATPLGKVFHAVAVLLVLGSVVLPFVLG
ncbi:DUF5808 domain-containing protein [Arsenicicoccus dermatophilus]|uniref:DUF5808 domain-containing protein n=1 Tax=Arsenicicoccus dermatophilus TaxID=1076331 RepID=UPI0039174D55